MKSKFRVVAFHRINRYDPIYLHQVRDGHRAYYLDVIGRSDMYMSSRQGDKYDHEFIRYGSFGYNTWRSKIQVGTAVCSIRSGTVMRLCGHHLVQSHDETAIMAIISSQHIED